MIRKFKKTFAAAFLFLMLAGIFLGEALFTEHLDYFLPFVGYGGTFRYPNITFANGSISLYGAAYFVGIAAMIAMCFYRSAKYEIRPLGAVLTAMLLAIFGSLGAKLLYLIENYEFARSHGFSFGGMSFFGTVLLMPIVIPMISIFFKKKAGEFLDYCTPAGLIMLASIRFGCFLKGCCAGVNVWILNRPVTIPVQLIECSCDLFLLGLIFSLEEKGEDKGILYFIFMGCYGGYRFFLEIIRTTPKDLLVFSHGQCFSLLCIMVSILVIFWHKMRSHA